MSDIIKPDFEKLALRGAPVNGEEWFVKGCDKIWTDYVEPLISTVKGLQKENEKLVAWKQSEIEIWSPLLKYFQTEDKLIKVGSSISEETLRRSKEYVRLQEENEQLKANQPIFNPNRDTKYDNIVEHNLELINENKQLQEEKKELVNEVEQLILYAEEDKLYYSELEHARKLVFKMTAPNEYYKSFPSELNK